MLELIRNKIEFDGFKAEFEDHFVEEANHEESLTVPIIRSLNDDDESEDLHYDEKAPSFPLAQSFAYVAEKELSGYLARLQYLSVYYKRKHTAHYSGKYYEGKDRFMVALQGEATLRSGGMQEPARPGEMWWFDITKEHSILNTGKSHFVGLVFDLHNSDWREQ